MATRAVLGIDPGNTSGWAVVTVERVPRLVMHGIYKLRGASRRQAAAQAVTPTQHIGSIVDELSGEVRLEHAVIEDQYSSPKNLRSGIKIGRSSGRWVEACAAHGLEASFIEASKWQHRILKKLLSGRTATSKQRKRAAQTLVKLRWQIELPPDSADAACMALYEANIQFQKSFLEKVS